MGNEELLEWKEGLWPWHPPPPPPHQHHNNGSSTVSAPCGPGPVLRAFHVVANKA